MEMQAREMRKEQNKEMEGCGHGRMRGEPERRKAVVRMMASQTEGTSITKSQHLAGSRQQQPLALSPNPSLNGHFYRLHLHPRKPTPKSLRVIGQLPSLKQ
jgi:hypothetical protein